MSKSRVSRNCGTLVAHFLDGLEIKVGTKSKIIEQQSCPDVNIDQFIEKGESIKKIPRVGVNTACKIENQEPASELET